MLNNLKLEQQQDELKLKCHLKIHSTFFVYIVL